MCIITYVPANVAIPEEGIENGAIMNDDGHGWAIASEYGLQVGKSMKFEKAYEEFEKARADHGSDSLALFHSRIATAGTVDEYNVHPFYVAGQETVIAHNGILPKQYQPGKFDQRSDTRLFAETVLPDYITESGVPSRRGGKRLGQLIGIGNKFVILSVASGKPRVRIVNAHMGDHHEGCWYSNSGYLKPTYRWTGTTSWWGADESMFSGLSKKEKESEGFFYASDCTACGNAYAVDMDTDWCEVCDTCNICFLSSRLCECLWRWEDDQWEERKKIEEFLESEIEPVEIEVETR